MHDNNAANRINTAIENQIATVTIHRPEQRNAFDDEMLRAMERAFDDLAAHPLRATILTGAGDICFCAGYDINCIDPEQSLDIPLPDVRFERIIHAVARSQVPVIAAMNGDAYGGGLDLALACDFRIARPAIKVGMTPVRLGLVYSDAGISRFLTKLGASTTRILFLTGRPLDATEALRLGIIDEIAASDDLLARALDWAHQMARGAPLAVAGTRRTIQYLEQSSPLSPDQQAELDQLRRDAFLSPELSRRLLSFRAKTKKRD